MIEYRDWLIVQTLYEKKNITKTGQTLFISQPTLTARIQKIEDVLGIRIIDRGNKGVHFTPQGEYLAKFAAEALLDFQKVKEQLMNMDQKVTGTLRLGASRFFTKYKLPRMLKLFKDQYPDVEFRVVTAWSHDICALLNSQEIHVGFVRGDYSWPEQKHLLFEEPIVLASKTALDFAQLPHLPRIDYRTDLIIKGLLDNWWRENFNSPPTISMEVDTVDTCKEMVRNGLGYAIMPGMILDGIQDVYKVEMTDKAGVPLLRRTWMIYQSKVLEINLVRAFINFVRELDLTE